MVDEKDIQFASDFRNAMIKLIKKLRKESPTSFLLSQTERSTMSLLSQNKEMLPSELAAAEMITNQSMSQVLNHLTALGYIIRKASETDGRKTIISLSELGQHTLQQFRHERDEWLAKAIAATCTEAERGLLEKAVIPLGKIIDYKS